MPGKQHYSDYSPDLTKCSELFSIFFFQMKCREVLMSVKRGCLAALQNQRIVFETSKIYCVTPQAEDCRTIFLFGSGSHFLPEMLPCKMSGVR